MCNGIRLVTKSVTLKITSSDTSDQVNRSLCGQCSGLGLPDLHSPL
ncbi:hypothetical protein [Klebsiella phage vB_KvaP_F5M1D]|nr:hypothetical protein [Klebsiella phage vB_KvaP_F5M1D]